MYKRYSKSNRKESFLDLVFNIIASIIGLFILQFVLVYYVNRVQFWYQVTHYLIPAIVIVVLVFCIYLFYLFQKKKIKEKHLEDTIKRIKETGFDKKFTTFIDMFGNDKKSVAWEHRGYKFNTESLVDFRDTIIQNNINISTDDDLELHDVLKYFIDEKERKYLSEGLGVDISHRFKDLSSKGDDFENLVVRLYDAMGYASKRIGGHGDQGGDVIANKDGESLLIQAKDYGSSVGNAAVQQAVAARLYYGCTKAAVITQSYFTNEAIELAKSNSVELIDGNLLKQRLLDYLKERWS